MHIQSPKVCSTYLIDACSHTVYNLHRIMSSDKMRRVGELSYDQKKVIGRGHYGIVFFGLFQNKLPIAVKRVMRDFRYSSSINEEKYIISKIGNSQEFLLRYFCMEADEEFEYIATELCEGTLNDLVEKKSVVKLEDGDERDILFQVTRGLDYLHNLDIIHGNLKPSSILYLNKPSRYRKFQIKITYSSLFTLNNVIGEFNDWTITSKVKFPDKSWIAPELYRTRRYTKQANMFTLGCLFGYTLSGGNHLFGNEPYVRNHRIMKMESMTMTQNDLKMPYSNDHLAFQLIQSMVEFEPTIRPTAKNVRHHHFFDCLHKRILESGGLEVLTAVKTSDKIQLSFYRNTRFLGRGGYGKVFTGMFAGQVVAVKRIECTDPDEGHKIFQREVEPMKGLKHANIVRFLAYTTDLDFIYIVTELCKGTLKEWIVGDLKYDGPKINDERKILNQVTQGLAYLHQNKIIHRDIKPSNILIYVDEGREPVMKLADFGICSILSVDNGFTNTNVENPSGTQGFMAPEMYGKHNLDNKVDIFALGCVFCCTLSTGGKHPFGDDEVTRSYMIKEKEPMVLKQEDLKRPYYSVDEFIFELIQSMVNVNPKERPTAAEILKNPFFKPLND